MFRSDWQAISTIWSKLNSFFAYNINEISIESQILKSTILWEMKCISVYNINEKSNESQIFKLPIDEKNPVNFEWNKWLSGYNMWTHMSCYVKKTGEVME